MCDGLNYLLMAAAAGVDGLTSWSSELIAGMSETLLAVLPEALDKAFGSLTAPASGLSEASGFW